MPDPRSDLPLVADERIMLTSWLRWHRETLSLKCAGLDPAQLTEAAVAPSNLTLLGLVRHLADVERHWFRRVLACEDAPPLHYSEAAPDGDFDVAGAEAIDVEAAFAVWWAECDRADEVVAALPSLDVIGLLRGDEFSARWVLVHMIEEYARHNGHADLLRERIDGVTGV